MQIKSKVNKIENKDSNKMLYGENKPQATVGYQFQAEESKNKKKKVHRYRKSDAKQKEERKSTERMKTTANRRQF